MHERSDFLWRRPRGSGATDYTISLPETHTHKHPQTHTHALYTLYLTLRALFPISSVFVCESTGSPLSSWKLA